MALAGAGCLMYDVGVNADEPDTEYVVDDWTSAEAHRASLELPEVRAAIEAARPLLYGQFGGFRFDVGGSPLASCEARAPVPLLAIRPARAAVWLPRWTAVSKETLMH